MASPCNNDPNEVIEKIALAKSASEKLDKFVNGTASETVQLGTGDPTPTVRNAYSQLTSQTFANARAFDDFVNGTDSETVQLGAGEPTPTIRKIVKQMNASVYNAEKFSKFVNGGVYETVQLGVGDPTPSIRNTVRIMKSAAAEIDGSDVSGKFVLANGGTSLRMLTDHLSDIVSVKDFGAVGDGVTDDTAAISAALNDGRNIFFPNGKYIISDTVVVTQDNSDPALREKETRIFWGEGFTGSAPQKKAGAVIQFQQDDIGIDVRSEGIHFCGLSFRGPDLGENDTLSIVAIRFKKTFGDNADDVDGLVESCFFYNCLEGVEFWGRSLTALNNLVVATSIGFKLCWDATDTSGYTQDVQTPPYANRAVRIIGNRKHTVTPMTPIPGNGSLVWNNGDILRSAQICGNLIDIGSTLLYDDKGVDSCLIASNTVDALATSRKTLVFNGVIYNTTICNNVFSYKYSNISNSMTNNGLSVLLDFNCTDISGINLSGNVFQGFTQHAIIFSNSSASTSIEYTDISITNNVFDFGGITGGMKCAARVYAQLTRVIFTGNIFTGNPSNIDFAFGISDATVYKISNIICTGNSMKGAIATSSSALVNPIKLDYNDEIHCVNSSKLDAVFNIGRNDTYTTAIRCTNKNVKSQRILFEQADDIVSLVALSDPSAGNALYAIGERTGKEHLSLGTGAHYWENVWFSSGAFNNSDARLKTDIEDIDDSVFKAWEKVDFKSFKKIDAVASKGENARIHVGVIAQQVEEAFASEGLDARRFGLIGYDEWDDEYEDELVVDAEAVYDENDNIVSEKKTHIEHRLVTPAGNRYSIRYGEALALECAYQRWLGEQRDARIAELEARLNEISGNGTVPSGASPDNI